MEKPTKDENLMELEECEELIKEGRIGIEGIIENSGADPYFKDKVAQNFRQISYDIAALKNHIKRIED